GRLLLAGVAVVGALALVEVLAPWVLPARCGRGDAPLWRPSRRVGWSLIPGVAGESVVCEMGVEVARHRIAIDADGHRDRVRDPGRPLRRRVLVLGDSFVEAVQVELPETFASLLEDELDVEMINAGVSGYATDNELRAFEVEARR